MKVSKYKNDELLAVRYVHARAHTNHADCTIINVQIVQSTNAQRLIGMI